MNWSAFWKVSAVVEKIKTYCQVIPKLILTCSKKSEHKALLLMADFTTTVLPILTEKTEHIKGKPLANLQTTWSCKKLLQFRPKHPDLRGYWDDRTWAQTPHQVEWKKWSCRSQSERDERTDGTSHLPALPIYFCHLSANTHINTADRCSHCMRSHCSVM